MKWEIKGELKTQRLQAKADLSLDERKINEEIINLILKNRGIKTKAQREMFLNPKLEDVSIKSVGLKKTELKKALQRISEAIDRKEQIVVFGDYDVDGICGTAILWETLHAYGANVMPYIPHRVDEGYGLSIKGIKNLALQLPGVKLIITVDNGIVANEAVEFARGKGIDVIITDHHLPFEDKEHKLPGALAVIHTTELCGAGVAWLLSQEIVADFNLWLRDKPYPNKDHSLFHSQNEVKDEHLALAALATIADMVPLLSANRVIASYGIEALRRTKRLGLLALFRAAGIEQEKIGTYEIGFMIAPRLNASGRMESAMDSLRLLCTKDVTRAEHLANKLNQTNKLRQEEMLAAAEHAIEQIRSRRSERKNLLIVAHESYQQGIIGLVAGRLVETFYRPAIVISVGRMYSKASVRSVSGFNIIGFLRQHIEYFVNVGGHPMAAGFTVETEKITILQKALEEAAEKNLSDEHLTKKLTVDCEIPLFLVSQNLYASILRLAPFGIGNPEPVFMSQAVVNDVRVIGNDGKHIRLELKDKNSDFRVEGVGFGMGEKAKHLKPEQEIKIAYIIDENTWNGNRRLQLRIKDISPSDDSFSAS